MSIVKKISLLAMLMVGVTFGINAFAGNSSQPTAIQIANYYYKNHIPVNLDKVKFPPMCNCTESGGRALPIGNVCVPECSEVAQSSAAASFPMYDPTYMKLVQLYKEQGYK